MSYPIEESLIRDPGLWMPRRKPIGPVKVNWENPVTNGIRGCYPHNEGSGTVSKDIADIGPDFQVAGSIDIDATAQGSASWSSDGGVGVSFTTADADAYHIPIQFSFMVGVASSNIQDFTALSIFKFNTTPADDRACFYSGAITGTSCAWMGLNAQGTDTFGMAVGHWNNDWFGTTNLPTTGETHVAICSYDYSATTGSLFTSWDAPIIDDAAPATSATDVTPIAIGQAFPGGGYGEGFDGTIYLTCFWNREISVAEALSLLNDPYQILVPA